MAAASLARTLRLPWPVLFFTGFFLGGTTVQVPPAASLAFWFGGAFVSVPKDVKVEKPIQIVYLIDEPGTGVRYIALWAG